MAKCKCNTDRSECLFNNQLTNDILVNELLNALKTWVVFVALSVGVQSTGTQRTFPLGFLTFQQFPVALFHYRSYKTLSFPFHLSE